MALKISKEAQSRFSISVVFIFLFFIISAFFNYLNQDYIVKSDIDNFAYVRNGIICFAGPSDEGYREFQPLLNRIANKYKFRVYYSTKNFPIDATLAGGESFQDILQRCDSENSPLLIAVIGGNAVDYFNVREIQKSPAIMGEELRNFLEIYHNLTSDSIMQHWVIGALSAMAVLIFLFVFCSKKALYDEQGLALFTVCALDLFTAIWLRISFSDGITYLDIYGLGGNTAFGAILIISFFLCIISAGKLAAIIFGRAKER